MNNRKQNDKSIRRRPFVTASALKNFLGASILTSVSSQVAVTTDAVIVSHMTGPDAMSAINMTMPINMLFSCVSILIGLGASVIAARAIGERDSMKVNSTFTVALILLLLLGIAVSAGTHIYSKEIATMLCDNGRILPYVTEYLEVLTGGAIVLILSNGMNYFVSADGKPGLVSKGVLAGAVANVMLDLLLVHLMGIKGSAWATLVNYVLTLAIVSSHFFSKESSYRLAAPQGKLWRIVSGNIHEGLPLMLGNLFLGGAVLAVNSMILDASGSVGIYTWSICLQLMMITFVVLNGVGNAMLAIGGALAGEKDYSGVRILTRLSLMFVTCSLAILVLVILVFPEAVSYMFGTGSQSNSTSMENSLRIFSLLLIPFAVTLVMRFLFQILEHRMLSLLLSAGQLLFILLSLWTFIKFDPELLWWSFPFSAVMLIAIQFAATFLMHIKERHISPVTLIPAGDGESLDMSIVNNSNECTKAFIATEEFLLKHGISREKADRIKECCNHIPPNNHVDLHIRIGKEKIHAVFRYTGRKGVRNDADSTLVNGASHKHMYGINVVAMDICL